MDKEYLATVGRQAPLAAPHAILLGGARGGLSPPKSTNKEVVRLGDVWVHYDGVPVLQEIKLSISPNEMLGVIGPNGGGKTTLLKVILGLIKPSRGRVVVFGKPPKEGREHVGYVPQYRSFARDFPASVWDTVLMGRLGPDRLFERYSKKDKIAAKNALETVEMSENRDKQIGRLSGGQQQRVLIARALVAEPKLLLLDEPLASVDAPMQKDIYELLRKLKQNVAIVLVSHDLSAVSTYVDKIACLNRKLFYHDTKEISAEELEAAYQCPIEFIAHGVPHRVLKKHK